MRRPSALAVVGVVAAVAVAVLGGCADEMEEARAQTGSGSTPAALVCAAGAKAVDLPAGLPSQAVLPDGIVVTGVESRTQGRTVVTGVSPKPFAQTLAAMQQAYSTRGWTASEGEVEDRDAESNFDGNGLRGRWAIREIPDCTGNTSVSLLLGK